MFSKLFRELLLTPGNLQVIFEQVLKVPWVVLATCGLVRIQCHSEGYVIIPPPSTGSAPWLLPSGTCSEDFQNQVSRMHPNQMQEPPQLTRFDAKEDWLNSRLPPDGRATTPIYS